MLARVTNGQKISKLLPQNVGQKVENEIKTVVKQCNQHSVEVINATDTIAGATQIAEQNKLQLLLQKNQNKIKESLTKEHEKDLDTIIDDIISKFEMCSDAKIKKDIVDTLKYAKTCKDPNEIY